MLPPTQQHCVSSADRTRADRPPTWERKFNGACASRKIFYHAALKTSGAQESTEWLEKSKLSSRNMGGKEIKKSTKNDMKAGNQIQSRWLYLRLEGSGGGKGEAASAARGVCERPELLFRACTQLYISQAKITISIKQWERKRGRGEPPWQIKKGGEVRGRQEGGGGGQWQGRGERGRDRWSGGGGRSDSSGAARGEECRLFLPDVLPSYFTQCGNQYRLFSPLGFPINR